MPDQSIHPSRKSEFWAGVKATIPLVVGAIPFGIIFGALAVNSGLSPAATQAMSTFVFAGSAQFIAAGLVASGTNTLVIILTTLVVNLRHMLYAATLAPHMKGLSQRWLLPLGFWLTDESFVVTIQRYDQPDKAPYKQWFFLGSEVFMYLNWQLCTFIGLKAGQAIQDASSWGLDFAMIVTFIGMLVPLVKNKAAAISVLVAAATAMLANGLPHKLGLILSALLGVIGGLLAERIWPVPQQERRPA